MHPPRGESVASTITVAPQKNLQRATRVWFCSRARVCARTAGISDAGELRRRRSKKHAVCTPTPSTKPTLHHQDRKYRGDRDVVRSGMPPSPPPSVAHTRDDISDIYSECRRAGDAHTHARACARGNARGDRRRAFKCARARPDWRNGAPRSLAAVRLFIVSACTRNCARLSFAASETPRDFRENSGDFTNVKCVSPRIHLSKITSL